MTRLVGKMPGYSFGDVLTTTNEGQGLTNVLKNLQDGFGNNSTVLIANNAIQFLYGGGNSLYLNGTALLSSGNNINLSTQDNPIFQGTGALTVPIGTTGERPSSPVNGMFRYNRSTESFEFYENGGWVDSTGIATITGTANQIVVTGTTDVVISLASNIQNINSLKTANINIDVVARTISTSTSSLPLVIESRGGPVQIGTPSGSFLDNLEIRNGGALKLYNSLDDAYSGWAASLTSPNNVWRMPQADGTAGQVFTTNGAFGTSWTTPSVSKIEVTVNQPGNTFIVGTIIRLNEGTNTYVAAKADTEENQRVVGIVSSVGDTFKYVISGVGSTGVTAITPGTLYYLDNTVAGTFVDEAPSTGFSKPLFIAITTNTYVWLNQRGQEL
jgi:hypothetical protein